jgi:hypothetical protein
MLVDGGWGSRGEPRTSNSQGISVGKLWLYVAVVRCGCTLRLYVVGYSKNCLPHIRHFYISMKKKRSWSQGVMEMSKAEAIDYRLTLLMCYAKKGDS